MLTSKIPHLKTSVSYLYDNPNLLAHPSKKAFYNLAPNTYATVDFAKDLSPSKVEQIVNKVLLAKPEKNNPRVITGFRDIPMGDWDYPDVGHISQDAITVQGIDEAFEKVKERVAKYPDEYYRMYSSPGGIRAWQIGTPMTPAQASKRGYFDSLNIDPFYVDLSQNQRVKAGTASVQDYDGNIGKPYIPPVYWSRITEKAGRPNDYVAYHIGNIGNPDSINLNSLNNVINYHDNPIRRHLQARNINSVLLKDMVDKIVSEHLGSISSPDKDMIYSFIGK